MIFNYAEVLCGAPIKVDGVGHLRSPKVSEICLSSGIGVEVYNLYLSFLNWSKEDLLKYSDILKLRNAEKLNREEFTAFDVATLQRETRELFTEMFSFFVVEDLTWSNADRCFWVVVNGDDDKQVRIGRIDNKNFENVRKMILQLNFVSLNEVAPSDQKFESEKAKELWERAKKRESELANKKKNKTSDDFYDLGNIISKLCALSNGYNYFNIFDLTIFQLYDAFFQMSYMRSVNLGEKIYSQHGGDHFNYEDWMKPIIKTKRR